MIGILLIIYGIRRWFLSIYNVIAPYQERKLVDIVFEERQLAKKIKILTIGGGTGLSSLLRGLKTHTSNITAVVTVADDGGSSGRLRKELGILPPGDIRNCLVALSYEESLMSELFKYRFELGEGLTGHSFGNLFLAAMTGISDGNFDLAVKRASNILSIRGKVLPISLDSILIKAEYSEGNVIVGESNISKEKKHINSISLIPSNPSASPEVIEAINDSKAIIIGPGSLYTSIICNLLIPGIAEAIKNSNAKKIYICNVMTQPGETNCFKASDHIKAIFSHTRFQIFDNILINNLPPKDKVLLERYKNEGSVPVEIDDDEISKLGINIIKAPVISETNLVRHDPEKLSEAIFKFILN